MTYIRQYFPGIVLLVISLFIAISQYRDYGFTLDDYAQHHIGMMNYNYAVHGDRTLKSHYDRDHGAGFELMLVFIEHTFNLDPYDHETYYYRHLICALFFTICLFAGYILFLHLFKSQVIACIGFLLLYLHPRIFAHSFFNTKDVPFSGMFILSFTLCYFAFKKDRYPWFFVLGLCCGFATSIRLLSVIMAGTIAGMIFLDFILAFIYKKKPLNPIWNGLAFLAGFCIMTYAAWPTLWETPVTSFIEAFHSLSSYPWKGSVLFKGAVTPATQLPWDYIPTWFLITTPSLVYISGFAGILAVLVSFVYRPMQFIDNTPKRNFLLYGVCLAVPVAAVIKMHSVVYDDWRHLYFIYPSFVLFALFAAAALYRRMGKWRFSIPALFGLQLASTAHFMINAHPLQQVYFNRLVSHEHEVIRKNYELDYWSAGLAHCLRKFIEEKQITTPVKIYAGNVMALNDNVEMLQEPYRSYIIPVDSLQQADYLIVNWRYSPDDPQNPEIKEIAFDLRLLNSSIYRVYSLH